MAPTFRLNPNAQHNHDPERGISLSSGTRVSVRASTLAPEPSGGSGQKRSVLKSYLTAQLDRNRYMSAIPIVSFFISGLIDAVAFNTWGCFVGMQTGEPLVPYLNIQGPHCLTATSCTPFASMMLHSSPVLASTRVTIGVDED